MVKRQRASSSSLFLMELILAILIFTMAGAVCVTLFARSYIIHRDSDELTKAVDTTKDIAEIILSCDTMGDVSVKLNSIYGDNLTVIGNDFSINVDELNINLSRNDINEYTYNIEVFAQDKENSIYDLEVYLDEH